MGVWTFTVLMGEFSVPGYGPEGRSYLPGPSKQNRRDGSPEGGSSGWVHIAVGDQVLTRFAWVASKDWCLELFEGSCYRASILCLHHSLRPCLSTVVPHGRWVYLRHPSPDLAHRSLERRSGVCPTRGINGVVFGQSRARNV